MANIEQEKYFTEIEKLVIEYYRKHAGKRIFPSDVASELELDPWMVFCCTEDLVKEGLLE